MDSKSLYWWSRYGNFAPGQGVLPHTGEVVAHYRRKLYRTQTDFATAAGVPLRTAQDWEALDMKHDLDRRIFLARLLKIPPALLGLDWRLLAYNDPQSTHEHPSEYRAQTEEEDSYYQYEDILVLSWDALYAGRLLADTGRFERRLKKLKSIVEHRTAWDRESWLFMLGQYYQLAAVIAQNRTDWPLAFDHITSATRIANEIDDIELLGLSWKRRAGLALASHDDQQAKQSAEIALDYLDRVRGPLKGNILLTAAEAHAKFSGNDETLAKQVRQWQDKALNLVYRDKVESDNSFLKLNLGGVHHERAKTLLQFYTFHPGQKQHLRDAHNEMKFAWGGFSSDTFYWKKFFLVTEARIYEAEHDLEASARLGKEALQVARESHSKAAEKQVVALYRDLRAKGAGNPYVDNLGVELGMIR